MPDNPRFPHVRVPMFLLTPPEEFPEMTPSHIATYVAVRSYAYTRSAASDRFARCFASHANIGKRARQSVATVKRNIVDLEKWGLLYRAGWRGKTREIVPVDHPQRFREARARHGLKHAIAEGAARLGAIRDAARNRVAHVAHPRPTKNKGQRVDILPPTPAFVPFDRRVPRSSETRTEVISAENMAHGRPTKNDLEEPCMKNTYQPPAEGAPKECGPSKNKDDNHDANSGADLPRAAPPAESQDQRLARIRDKMRRDPDFARLLE